MDGFLPDSLSEWLGVVVQFVGTMVIVVTFVLRHIRKPLQEEFDRRFAHHGERLGTAESNDAAGKAAIESHERQLERLHLQLSMATETQGRHDERLERVLMKLEQHERERLNEDRQISVQLARLEEQMKIMGPLAQALISIAKSSNTEEREEKRSR
jgi:chromosome segregation ATPase